LIIIGGKILGFKIGFMKVFRDLVVFFWFIKLSMKIIAISLNESIINLKNH